MRELRTTERRFAIVIKWFCFIFISCLIYTIVNLRLGNGFFSKHRVSQPVRQPTVHFGASFAGLESTNMLDTSCRLSTGKPVCCAIFNQNVSDHISIFDEHSCTTTRLYIPSPFEASQIKLATFFDSISDLQTRNEVLIKHITSDEDIFNSSIWLNRVKYHAQRSRPVDPDEEVLDKYFLSRFHVTRKCQRLPDSSWDEWIEPITIHARNPFSLLNLPEINKTELALRHPASSTNILNTGVINNDFVLLSPSSKAPRTSKHRNYLFDAGTSTFQSSLWWFTCLYHQQGIFFDEIFGWEYSLLDPVPFWEEVPALLREKYHFYNTPMTSDLNGGNSPLRMIKSIANENDFVSFKLDIDSHVVEIPTVLHLLNDKDLHKLVDEFFFEYHFRCEFMMRLGWGSGMSETFSGEYLRRHDAMLLFQKLRHLGVRSHFWP